MSHKSLFLAGGQSNATSGWASAIGTALTASGRYGSPQVVHINHGGNGLSYWWDGGPGVNYAADWYAGDGSSALETAITAIEAAGDTWSIEGFFWLQGETDTGSSSLWDKYFQRFRAMCLQIETDHAMPRPIDVCLAVVDGNQADFYDDPDNLEGRTRDDVDELRAKQWALGWLPNMHAVDSRYYERTDQWHMTTAERDRLGTTMAAQFLEAFPLKYSNLLTKDSFHDEWDMADAAASTTVLSYSGTNNATLNGGENTVALTVAGPDGIDPAALGMDGTDDYIALGTLSHSAGDPITLLTRIKMPTVDTTNRAVFLCNSTQSTMIWKGSSTYCSIFAGSASDRWDYNTLIPTADVWYDVAVRSDGTNAPDIIVNGVTYTPTATVGSPSLDFSGFSLNLGGPVYKAPHVYARFAVFFEELSDADIAAYFARDSATIDATDIERIKAAVIAAINATPPNVVSDVVSMSGSTDAADNLETAGVAYTATRGLAGTALPNAAADAAGGLAISDAGGLDLDGLATNAATAVTQTVATAIRSAVGLASANLDTQFANVGGGSAVSADVVSAKRTWVGDDYRASNIVEVKENYAGVLALKPDLNPGTTIASVDSVSITGAATVTATSLSVDRSKTKAHFTVPALTTTGTYTVVVTVTTIEGDVIPTTATLVVN